MNERPTPETDAFAKTMYSRGVDSHHDGREALKHAKRLERERDEARDAMREAWLAMDETDGTDRMINWQNKYAYILSRPTYWRKQNERATYTRD